jgi:SagB-type dehydrogenase family enzyme
MRAPAAKRARAAGPQAVSARLSAQAELETRPDGHIFVRLEGYSLDLGWFSAAAAKRALALPAGVPLASFGSRRSIDRELMSLAQRLARHGLLEYPVGQKHGVDAAIIEPQVADYWPQTPPLRTVDVLALSRFAYLRRRGDAMVLESPRAGALFRICDPEIMTALASLSTPQRVGRLRRQGFPGFELLALLVDCQILFKVDPAHDGNLRPVEGDADLVLWDFHDLLFHTRSTPGRHANPVGGVYSYAAVTAAPPAVRRWPGEAIDLNTLSRTLADASPIARLLRGRHSVRSFDAERPITLAELAQFLDSTARVVSNWESHVDLGGTRPLFAYATRPYPSAGASYELELYLAVDKCDGLARGFYHYDAGRHALVPIDVRTPRLEALFSEAQHSMDAPATPQIVITIAARFGRVSWKYSSLAYALILKDVGVLIQTLYLMATDMGLGGCAIGSTNIDLFAKMTGVELHVEGPVGQFALGRGKPSGSSE